jgi:hypothetical protein
MEGDDGESAWGGKESRTSRGERVAGGLAAIIAPPRIPEGTCVRVPLYVIFGSSCQILPPVSRPRSGWRCAGVIVVVVVVAALAAVRGERIAQMC